MYGIQSVICWRRSIRFQEDLKDYTANELHYKVKVLRHAAKILERSDLASQSGTIYSLRG